ncbi:MAG TPA: Gfo/Idh/MocA family oxidoreductase [Planctomycetaceae bacterium]|nr:Gfo/Idh/MocA family oxidoreductase [Planctomycetaceae bacterium]
MVQERTTPAAGIRLAIVGCGQIGRLHAARIADDGRARIVALCDPLPAHAVRLQAEFAHDARVFADVHEMTANCPLDAAIVCTPTHQHFEQTRLLADSGIPVLCEKPLADSRERIVQLVEMQRRGGTVLSVSYQRRYGALFRTLRREMQSGRHGPLRSLTVQVSEPWQQTIAGTWRDDPNFNPGGFISDAGSHKIDMVFYLTGLAPREVFAHSDFCGSRVDIVTTVSARLENDVPLGMSFVGNSQGLCEDYHIHCERADLIYRDGKIAIVRNREVEPITDFEPETNPDAAFADLLMGSSENLAPAEAALPVWDFTQAVLQSARTGQVIRLTDL